MKYKILIVEEKSLEVDKVREVAKSFDCQIVSALNIPMALDRLGDVDGVITDFIFSPWGTGNRFFQERAKALGYYENMPPSGTIILIEAATRRLPAVVCVQMYETSEPSFAPPPYAWFYDGYVYPVMRGEKPPFGWVSDKDWRKAIEMLIADIEKK